MTTSVANVTLDGVTDVNIFGNIWEWFGGYTSFLDLYFDDGNPATTAYQANLSLEGDFYTNGLTTWANGMPVHLNVTDVNDGGDRTIAFFRATSNGGDVNADIQYTNIDYFLAQGDGDVTLNLGEIEITNVRLDDGKDYVELAGFDAEIDTLETRSARDILVLSGEEARVRLASMGDGNDLVSLTGINSRIDALQLNDGNDKVRLIGDGARIDLLHIGDGNDQIEVGVNTRIGAVESWDGSKTVTIESGGRIDQLEVGSNANDVNMITVEANGALRSFRGGEGDDHLTIWGRADQISLDSGTNSVVTGGEFVGSILSYSGDNTVTIGAGGARSIGFSGGEDDIEIKDGGYVEVMELGGARDTLLVKDGAGVGAAIMGDGNNAVEVTGENSRINSLSAFDGNDTVRLKAGGDSSVDYRKNEIDQMSLGHGENKVYLSENTWVGSLQTGNDQDKIWLYADTNGNNAAEVLMAETGNGDDIIRLNGDAWMGSLRTERNDDLVLLNDESEIDALNTGDGNDTVTSNDGYLQSVHTNDGEDLVTIGSGGANFVHTGRDNDTVTTSDQWVWGIRLGDGDDLIQQGSGGGDIIRGGDGNDTVELGVGGVRLARLGDGNDVIRLVETSPSTGVAIQGDGGVDEVDFRAFSVGVDFDNRTTEFQNLAPDEFGDAPAGWFSFVSIEVVTGTDHADTLRGGDLKNDTLDAGKGDDRVWGNDGADYIIGGAGKDILYGGDGPDTFYFKSGHGTKDRIKDFDVTEDVIEFKNAASLADISLTQNGADVFVESLVDGVRVRVENVTVADMNNDDVFGF